MTDATPDDFLPLPCGCQMWTEVVDGSKVFVFVPHALDCKWFEYVQSQSAEMGKPQTTIDLR